MPAHFYAAQITLLLMELWGCWALCHKYLTNFVRQQHVYTCVKKKTGHVIIELFPKKIKNWPMYNQS